MILIYCNNIYNFSIKLFHWSQFCLCLGISGEYTGVEVAGTLNFLFGEEDFMINRFITNIFWEVWNLSTRLSIYSVSFLEVIWIIFMFVYHTYLCLYTFSEALHSVVQLLTAISSRHWCIVVPLLFIILPLFYLVGKEYYWFATIFICYIVYIYMH